MLRPSVADRQIFIPTKFPHKPITFVSRSGQREQRGKAARGEPGGTGTGSSARRVGAAGGCEPLGQVTANTTGLLETSFEARCSLSQHIQSEYLIFFSFFFFSQNQLCHSFQHITPMQALLPSPAALHHPAPPLSPVAERILSDIHFSVY